MIKIYIFTSIYLINPQNNDLIGAFKLINK